MIADLYGVAMCSNGSDETKAFIAAVQVTNFKSPKHKHLSPQGSTSY